MVRDEGGIQQAAVGSMDLILSRRLEAFQLIVLKSRSCDLTN